MNSQRLHYVKIIFYLHHKGTQKLYIVKQNSVTRVRKISSSLLVLVHSAKQSENNLLDFPSNASSERKLYSPGDL